MTKVSGNATNRYFGSISAPSLAAILVIRETRENVQAQEKKAGASERGARYATSDWV